MITVEDSYQLNTGEQSLLPEETLKGCVRGERTAQKIVYEVYYKKMYAICLRYSNNEDEARDLLHDGFMKLFEKFRSNPEIRNSDAWVRKLFVNHCLDYVRSAYKRYIVYASNDEMPDVLNDESDADDAILNRYGSDRLLRAFTELRPDYRVILNLYAVEGMTHQQIAEELGIQEATSRSKLLRARNQLKKLLAT